MVEIVKLNIHLDSRVTLAHNHSIDYALCWGLVLKYYELRTRQHRKMLNVKVLRPPKHYFPREYDSLTDEGYERHTFINTTHIKLKKETHDM
jgi:hypothetical protein